MPSGGMCGGSIPPRRVFFMSVSGKKKRKHMLERGRRMRGYKQAFQKAFPYTIPVLTGYLFIGIAFGVMYAEKGYSALWAVLMSVLVYAGSGQYLAVNFFVPGVSFLHVAFMTLMVNI